MAIDLDAIKASLAEYRRQLAAKQAEKEGYFNKAKEIEAVYDRLKNDKDLIESYRKSVKTFKKEDYDTFKGYQFSESYMTKMDALIDDYDLVIKNIDTNLDRLNNEITRYENLGYQCNGIIGSLQSAANSLVNKIQNWVN